MHPVSGESNDSAWIATEQKRFNLGPNTKLPSMHFFLVGERGVWSNPAALSGYSWLHTQKYSLSRVREKVQKCKTLDLDATNPSSIPGNIDGP